MLLEPLPFVSVVSLRDWLSMGGSIYGGSSCPPQPDDEPPVDSIIHLDPDKIPYEPTAAEEEEYRRMFSYGK